MIHSFHLALLAPSVTLRALRRGPRAAGLRHAECLALMRLGSPAVSLERMQLRRLAMFAEWDDESTLERFLADEDLGRRLADGWHVRLQYLRRYGEVAALAGLPAQVGSWDPEEPIVAVTLARLKAPCTPPVPEMGAAGRTPGRAPPRHHFRHRRDSPASHVLDLHHLAQRPRDDRHGPRPQRRPTAPHTRRRHG
jgi:hypothetical protein